MGKSIFLLFIGAVAAMAQPSIRTENGVLNASSYLPDIARGSWFVIFGSNMGPANIAIHPQPPFPTDLAGTRVTFTAVAGGAVLNARLWYTVAGQLAGLLPSGAVAGDYDVRVIYNGQPSPPYRVKVVDRSFGFATVAQDGMGPAQATNANLNNGISLVRFTSGSISFNNRNWEHRPAYIGETLILWGTGLGPDAQSDADGVSSGDQTAAGNVRVIVGTAEIIPAYAGRSSGSPGLDQINFSLTGNIPTGCNVSVQVRAGGRTSNVGSLAITAPGQPRCTHPALSEEQLRRLDQGGTLTLGVLGLVKTTTKTTVPGLGTFDVSFEGASGSFGRYTISQVADASFSIAEVGACWVYRRTGDEAAISGGSIFQPLNAGNQLTLNGPNVSNRPIPREGDDYNLLLYASGFMGFGGEGTPTLAQGTYTIRGTGGPDIGAFEAMTNFPGAFNWTNENAIPATVPRNQNLSVTWTGGGDGLVYVGGYAGLRTGGTEDDPTYDAAGFTCVAQASAGNLSVPSGILQQLPPVSADLTSGSIGVLSVLAVPDPARGQGLFTAPLTAGGNIDFGFFSYATGTTKTVGFN